MGKKVTPETRMIMLETGKIARRFRWRTGWSMKQVADKLGVSITAVAEFEKGRTCSPNVLLGLIGLRMPITEIEEVCHRVFADKVFRPEKWVDRRDHLQGGVLPGTTRDPEADRGPEADHDVEGDRDRK